MRSVTYWHPLIYSLLMRLSYQKNYINRYEVICNLIEPDSSVVDICCGDCKIYDYLKEKNINYLGLDFNPTFVRVAGKKHIPCRLFNMYENEIPQADYVLLQASLYQFVPHQQMVLNKCLHSDSRHFILSEAVKNHACSKSRWISFLAQKLNNPGDGLKSYRFNIETLRKTLLPHRQNIIREFLSPNQIEYVVLMKKNG